MQISYLNQHFSQLFASSMSMNFFEILTASAKPQNDSGISLRGHSPWQSLVATPSPVRGLRSGISMITAERRQHIQSHLLQNRKDHQHSYLLWCYFPMCSY